MWTSLLPEQVDGKQNVQRAGRVRRDSRRRRAQKLESCFTNAARWPCPTNPLALEHFANHPSKGLQPNVMQVAVDFPFDIDPSLEEYIPNKFLKAPTLLGTPDRTACMYGLRLVMIRDVKDEELFVNNWFQTGAKDLWPKWYSPMEGNDGNDGSNLWDAD